MNKQLCCENGHYYDSSYNECPSCPLDEMGFNISNGFENNRKTEMIEKTLIFARESDKINDVKEIKENIEEEINLAGWLVIISEKGKGYSYKITFGFNSIGKDRSNDISILNSDNTISIKKHSSIIYDYNNNQYFLKHEEGKFLTYLNEEMILETKELNNRDKIKIGNTEFIFIALCNENFKWDI